MRYTLRKEQSKLDAKILLISCFIFLITGLNAQVITGKVNGKQNTEINPIPGAFVQILGSDKTFSTDANGQFSFSAAPYPI